MKRLLLIIPVLLLALSAKADFQITATVAFTNGTVNGETITCNSDTRTFTNSVVLPAYQVLTNSAANGSAGNLFAHLAVTPFSGIALGASGVTNITLKAATNAIITVTVSSGWAVVSYFTNTVGVQVPVLVPLSGYLNAAQRTNVASAVAAMVNDSADTNGINTSKLVGPIAATTLSTSATLATGQVTNALGGAPILTNSISGNAATATLSTTATSANALATSATLATGQVTNALGGAPILTNSISGNAATATLATTASTANALSTSATLSVGQVTNALGGAAILTNSISGNAATATTANGLHVTGYIVLAAPFRCDGTGAIIQTNDLTASYLGQARFSNSAAKAGNWIDYFITVPEDFDSSVDLKVKRWKFQLSGADTGKHAYKISVASVADSAAYSATPGTEIALSFAGDASGASGDVESVSGVTLTGWKSAITAGQLMVIRVARDGNDGTLDTSTVDSYSGPLVISYGVTQ